jgi:hypothetical protein
MSDQGSDDDQVAQRFDVMLLRLLKTPPNRAPSSPKLSDARRGASLLELGRNAPAPQQSAEALLTDPLLVMRYDPSLIEPIVLP